jgi:predicted RecA/RadA family phage recombinase
MATNFIKPGKVVTLTAPTGGIKSGEGFMSGSLFAVAQYDAEQATPVEGALVGVWSLPKGGTPLTFAEGAAVFWDNAAGTCKASAAGYFLIGTAILEAGANDTTVTVRLDGHSLTAVPAPG